MKKNMGKMDALIRTLLALIIIILWGSKVISGALAILMLVIAGIFVLTSLVNYCPLYSLFGINTCKKKDA